MHSGSHQFVSVDLSSPPECEGCLASRNVVAGRPINRSCEQVGIGYSSCSVGGAVIIVIRTDYVKQHTRGDFAAADE